MSGVSGQAGKAAYHARILRWAVIQMLLTLSPWLVVLGVVCVGWSALGNDPASMVAGALATAFWGAVAYHRKRLLRLALMPGAP